MATLCIDALNRLDRDAFVEQLGGIFEHSPWIAAQAHAAAPFESLEALHRTMVAVVAAAPRARRLALIRAHPDLAGRLAATGALTAASSGEQAGAGLDLLDADERARFDRLNTLYRDRFGFPFVVAVKGLDRQAILAQFEARLGNAPDTEEARAIDEIARIAWFRLSA